MMGLIQFQGYEESIVNSMLKTKEGIIHFRNVQNVILMQPLKLYKELSVFVCTFSYS